MKSFTDNAGRTWAVLVNVDTIKRVRGLVKVDLLDLDSLDKLIRDPILLCDVVYAVCQPEAEAKHVTDEYFGRAMAGDPIDQATKALLEELADFSPSPRDRANLRRVLETTWRVLDRARDVIEARIAGLNVEQVVEEALATVGVSSGAAPVSPASTPAPSPSLN